MLFEKLKKGFYNLPLLSKICVTVQALVIVLFTCQSVVLGQIGIGNIKTERYSAAAQAATYANLLIQKEEEYLLGLGSNCAISTEVQEAMRLSNLGRDGSALLAGTLAANQYGMNILNLVFYNLGGGVIDYMAIDASSGPVGQNPSDGTRPFGMLVNRRNGLPYEWEFIPQRADSLFACDNSPKVTLWYLVKDNSTKQHLGVIALSIDARKLLTTQSEVRTSFDSIVIVDAAGSLVDGRGELYKTLTQADRAALISATPPNNAKGEFDIPLNGVDYYVGYEKALIDGCYVYSLVSEDTNTIGSGFINTSIVGIGACVLLSIPLFTVGAKFITRPIQVLTDAMHRYAEGDRSVAISFHSADEIGKLGRMFNRMVQKNNKLVAEKYELTIHKQEAQLMALQAQIDPHFIFNMLNLIQWMALEKEEAEIATLVNSAASVIRYSLNRKDQFVTVQQEMELVGRYMDVQKRVRKDRIQAAYTLEAAAQSAYIPKFIIQPVIENSIKHGQRSDGSVLRVHVRVGLCGAGRKLAITVEDNGRGIPANVLRYLPERGWEIESRPALEDGNRYALTNISERLKLYYGAGSYSFTIQSKENQGTRTRIVIPNDQELPAATAIKLDQIHANRI